MARFIMGKNCLKEVLKHHPERLIKVFTSASGDPLIDELQKGGIPVKGCSPKELTRLVESESHQSFVAEVKPREGVDFKEFLDDLDDKDQALVLMLDSIFDPHNLGAILRAAECFGVDGVVWSKNRGADLTPVVSKASVGASELVPIVKVSNLADAIRKFQKHEFWAVTAEVEEAEPLSDFTFPKKTLLIMGSEGKGVQSIVSKQADSKVAIPMWGKIDSLNVSQATSVLLSHYRLTTVASRDMGTFGRQSPH